MHIFNDLCGKKCSSMWMIQEVKLNFRITVAVKCRLNVKNQPVTDCFKSKAYCGSLRGLSNMLNLQWYHVYLLLTWWNHPIGHICTALLKAVLKENVDSFLISLYYLANWKFRFLRMIKNLFVFKAVDCDWRKQDLIGQISWNNSVKSSVGFFDRCLFSWVLNL